MCTAVSFGIISQFRGSWPLGWILLHWWPLWPFARNWTSIEKIEPGTCGRSGFKVEKILKRFGILFQKLFSQTVMFWSAQTSPHISPNIQEMLSPNPRLDLDLGHCLMSGSKHGHWFSERFLCFVESIWIIQTSLTPLPCMHVASHCYNYFEVLYVSRTYSAIVRRPKWCVLFN